MKHILFIGILFLAITSSSAQTCTMNISTQKVCLGNTVSFSVSISGATGTISNYTWGFGNTATSNQATPIYQYTSAGTYTPTVTVNFSDGSKCTTSGPPIQVFTLPQTKFSFSTSSSECFKNNVVCIKNLSVAGASNAPLDTGNLNWGDGTKAYFKPSFGQKFCHSFIDPFGGIYTPVIEIQDTNGCLSRLDKPDSITIFPKMGAVSFNTNYMIQCPQTPVKFTNFSAIPKTQVKKFLWDFGDGNSDTIRWDTLTHIYTQAGIFSSTLYITDINNCSDSFYLSPSAQNTILDPTIYIWSSANSCFRNNTFIFSSLNSGAQIAWALYLGNQKFDTSQLNSAFGGPYHFSNCGTYHLRMYVNYPGSSCKSFTDSLIDVYGPNAVAQNDTAKIIKQIQCVIHDTVYFRTPVPYLMCHNDNLSMIRIWDFGDVYAPQCTTDTKKGINVNKNCNWSKDSMNVWHYYTPGKEGCYKVSVFMKDTIRGCWDSDSAVMKLTAPSAHWDSTTNPIRRGVYYKGDPDICIGSRIVFHFNDVLPQCGYDSAWFLPDSACPNGQWIYVPLDQSKVSYTYSKTCDTTGWVTYGAIVKNGADENGISCYDTAWYHFKLFLLPINPKVNFKLDGACQPYTIYANLIDSIQDSIVKAEWRFETRSSYLSIAGTVLSAQNFTQDLILPNDSIIHGQTYISPTQGVVFATLKLTNSRGCNMSSQSFVTLGIMKDIAVSNTRICLGDTVVLYDFGQYYSSSYNYWADSNRAKLNLEKVWWDIGDGKGFSISQHNPVIKYTKPGTYIIRMIIQDSTGCKDTVTAFDKINVDGIDAQMQYFDSIQYCAPFFVNFVDSSIVTGTNTINSWEWKFSDGKPRNLLQSPQHEFTSNGTFYVTLNVVSSTGCTSTITKSINIKGPQPSFNIISDTVGCRPFTAVFKNTTGYQLMSWQWNFRDQNNSIFSTTKDSNVLFTYTVPGIYKIRLFGQDTIRDPATNTLKTCRAYFPDTTTELPVRVIRVLPGADAKIIGPDTICPNQLDTFISRCDSTFKIYNWLFGDGNSLTKNFPDSFIQKTYIKSGTYTMSLFPVSPDPKACADTAYKTIFVDGITADFTIDESQSPLYQFKNNSLSAVTYKWFIGADLTNMFSQLKDPSKTIIDSGAVLICLQAFNSRGCWDTACKEVKAKTHVKIPNVFTPNGDGINDAFDIDIVGYSKYELIIYNRWGTPVFKGDRDGVGNDGINWNGKENNSGAQCSDGTYLFIFNYKLNNDVSEKTVHGTVTLIRNEN